ncbi:DUF1997 domain-containing protein [Synechococcus sp. CCY 9618]|uniref:DUF1997 domain-containing protein n=1 Tax=Synechococcus sp. CCY 9618 TaxID=2815602 RepID=UPI001C2146DC|nr:DUF1997 domain-containing protein [Synechococcus sp. CCY 9618]
MSLAFSASQQLDLPVARGAERLPAYLDDEQRVVEALLDPKQLDPLGPGRYRYTVSQVRVFQLRIQPVVELQALHRNGRLELEALDCQLEGLGLVEDFRLGLCAWLAAGDGGLVGEASLSVTVSRPTLLRLIPPRVLEATGRSVLGGILLGIKTRVGQQLLGDFQRWCQST